MMKARLVQLQCRHWDGIDRQPGDPIPKYWAIELEGDEFKTAGGTGFLHMPMISYPMTSSGYEDHDAAKALLEALVNAYNATLDTDQQPTVS